MEEIQTQKSAAAQREEQVLEFWKSQNIFEKTTKKDAPKGEFVFYDGPPTANGMPGLHHIEPQSFKDAIPRYKTMQGFHVPRKAGWDTHGLPVELQVEKELGLKSKKEIESYGVEAFNQKCKESVWKYKAEWMKMRKRMGYWTDMENAYITYTNNYIEALWGVVGKANESGYLYKDFKVVPWCPRCGTGLSSHELNQPGAYKDVKDLSVYIKFKVADQENTYILAWTTTPWTLPGNVALAVGEDIDYVKIKKDGEFLVLAKERFSVFEGEQEIAEEMKGVALVGLSYEPLYPYLKNEIEKKGESIEKAFKVYAADFVTTTDGTGVVHTAVMYGADDFDLGTKLGLPKFHIVNEEGKFIDAMDFLSGRYVKESDENGKPTLAVDIIDDLKKRNLFLRQENIKHSYPHCWRCDTPLIYYARSSWYFRMSALRDKLLAANETINWEPQHIKEGRFGEWLSGIKDWAISRDRYWGTPIPVWETADGEKVVVDSLAKLKSLTKRSGNKYFVMRHGQTQHNVSMTWNCNIDHTDPLTQKGMEQIADSAKVFDEEIDVIIASPFKRTQDTARIFAETKNISAHIESDERLHEWNVGAEYDGKPLDDFFKIRNNMPDRYGYKTADGESYIDVVRRAGEVLYELEQKYQGKNILLVSHGAVTRALQLIAEGIDFASLFKATRDYKNFDNAEIRSIDFVPLPHNADFELDFHKPYIDQVELVLDGKKLTRTKEVMDVWFDSGAMPYAQDHTLGSEMNFSPKPADYISEAIDQTRGWFYTLHAVSNMIADEPRAAFKNVICLGHILDANGQKMSKSKGNVVDPWEMFAKYGADTIRLWMYSVNGPGESKNYDEKTVAEIQNKVFNLAYNVLSFYEMYRDPNLEIGLTLETLQSENVLDTWIIARLNQLVSEMTTDLDNFELFHPTRSIKDFIDDMSTWYVRRSRERLRDNDTGAKKTLYIVLKTLAQLLAPFAPFSAEDLWQKLKTGRASMDTARHDSAESDAESVHLSTWPKAGSVDTAVIEEMEKVRSVCTEGNALRKKVGIAVKQPLASFAMPHAGLEKYYALVQDELNVKGIVVGEFALDTNITPELKKEGEYRELVRAVQDMRKEKGLSPSDAIALTIPQVAHDTIADMELFKKTVQADNVSIGESIALEVK